MKSAGGGDLAGRFPAEQCRKGSTTLSTQSSSPSSEYGVT
jgi:hypothetical protein